MVVALGVIMAAQCRLEDLLEKLTQDTLVTATKTYTFKAILIVTFDIESLKITTYIGTRLSYSIALERYSLTHKSSMDRGRKGADHRAAKEAVNFYHFHHHLRIVNLHLCSKVHITMFQKSQSYLGRRQSQQGSGSL